ncbi:MAG: Ni/Fe hydrogenase subunit alpha [Acidobacteriota bacterium]|nr:MAG: Ni/Fe hydrogenase subunit alpha [Acidobacteriota bacterium]
MSNGTDKAARIGCKTLRVDTLARVEGEGALFVRIERDRVVDVKLKIFEPPRFFEAFLRGRSYAEVPDITARICGICPVAYQMSSVHAIERAFGVNVGRPLRDLRRLLYCAEWIESHALHIYLLHAPDFLGYESAVAMARDHRALVERGLRLKKAGNELMALVGGREIHPINVRVGGFYRTPSRRELRALRDELSWARDAALETVHDVARFDFPDLDRDYEFVALRHESEYPMNEGRLISNKGLAIDAAEFEAHIREEHQQHSNALHARIIARGAYFVGPQARYNLNHDRLSPLAQQAAREAGLGETSRNPFQSIIVRAVETVYACDEALRLIDAFEPPERPAIEIRPRLGVGHAITEAPRGILYNRYQIDNDGTILAAQIVPPTSQNQKTIEEDLHEFVGERVDMADERLQWECEQAIRNYDPCISCATHFVTLHVDRSD